VLKNNPAIRDDSRRLSPVQGNLIAKIKLCNLKKIGLLYKQAKFDVGNSWAHFTRTFALKSLVTAMPKNATAARAIGG
jgi:hypothetical protein